MSSTNEIFKIVRYASGKKGSKFYDKFKNYYKCNNNHCYLRYITRTRPNDTENYNLIDLQTGDVLNLEEELNNIVKLDDNQNIWDTVISFSKEHMNTFDLTDPKFISSKIAPYFNQMLKDNFLEPDNVKAFYAIQTDTKNTHIHLGFYEKEKSFKNSKGDLSFKRKGDFKLDSITKFRNKIGLAFENIDYNSVISQRKLFLFEVANQTKTKYFDFWEDENFKKLFEYFKSKDNLKSSDFFFNKQPEFIKSAVSRIYENFKNKNKDLQKLEKDYLDQVVKTANQQKTAYKKLNIKEKTNFVYENTKGKFGIESRIGNCILKALKNEIYKDKRPLSQKKPFTYEEHKTFDRKSRKQTNYKNLVQAIADVYVYEIDKQKQEAINKFRRMNASR